MQSRSIADVAERRKVWWTAPQNQRTNDLNFWISEVLEKPYQRIPSEEHVIVDLQQPGAVSRQEALDSDVAILGDITTATDHLNSRAGRSM